MFRLFPQGGEEAGGGAGEVLGALGGEGGAIVADVLSHHLEAVFQGVAGDLAVGDVFFFMEGDGVGEGPGVALTGGSADLIVGGKAFLVAGHDGREEFAGEFLPEMVEEILEGPAHAAVVVRGAKEEDVGAEDAFLEGGVIVGGEGGVGVDERQGFVGEVEGINGTAVLFQKLCGVLDGGAGDGFLVEAAGDGEDVRGIVGHGRDSRLQGGGWQWWMPAAGG